MKANKYFDFVASEYNKNRTKGIHGYFAKKETKVIINFLNIKKGEKILDAGCGSGLHCKKIKDLEGIPYGIDISKNMIKNLRKNKIKGETADIENFNLNRKFDKALCAGVFEFIKNHNLAIKSIKKHLKKNGILVLHYPRISLLGILYLLFHLILHGMKTKLFTKKQIENLLKENKFSIEEHEDADLCASVVKAKNKY